ncbi:GrpB family protein [Paenibacillus oralis]|nr:GrpB family protein [Paenibacillus oralis]
MDTKPVIIEDYNYYWPSMFEELALILKKQLGYLIIDIQHVGP